MSKFEKFEYGDGVTVSDGNSAFFQMAGSVVSFKKNHSNFYWVKIGGFNHEFKEEQLVFTKKAVTTEFEAGDTVRLSVPGTSYNKMVGVITKHLEDGRVSIHLEDDSILRLNTRALIKLRKPINLTKKVEAEEVPFYVVWNPDGHNCAQKYTEVKDALKNAESRTSTYEGECEYYVLRVVKKFSKKMVKDSFEYSKED